MPFEWPSFAEAKYRLLRLRRLIAFGVLLPLSLFAIMGLFGASTVGGSITGLVTLALFFTAIIAGHAVLFPNGYEETLVISVILTYLAVFATFFAGSFLGWVIFVGFSLWLWLAGQGRFMAFQTASRAHRPSFSSRIKVGTRLSQARDWFPLRPDTERGRFRCGALTEDGVFPVWFETISPDIFEGIAFPEDPEDELEDVAGEMPPSFWAKIEVDEPDYQKTLLGQHSNAEWTTESVVEHRFRSTRTACLVTETDTPESYPMAQSLTLWLNDYQKDGLVHLRDLLEQRETLSLREVHRWSLLTLTGRWFARRQIERFSEA